MAMPKLQHPLLQQTRHDRRMNPCTWRKSALGAVTLTIAVSAALGQFSSYKIAEVFTLSWRSSSLVNGQWLHSRCLTSLHAATLKAPPVPVEDDLDDLTGAHMVKRKQDALDRLPITEETKKAVREVLGYTILTKVQTNVLPLALSGHDLVVNSKTGTGKTLAFGISVVELLLMDPLEEGENVGARALILSPTRELSLQTLDVLNGLLTHHPDIGLLSITGAGSFAQEKHSIFARACDIIVATPGRLLEHMESDNGFNERLKGLQLLVLDEADRLLNGFKGQITQILEWLPPPDTRQGMLFSATMPKDTAEIASLALRPNYRIVDVANRKEGLAPIQVNQRYVVLKQEEMIPALWGALNKELDENGASAKILVFFTTARLTQYFSELFQWSGLDVAEMHSKKAQGRRLDTASRFWSSRSSILFSTDISARGMDYPDVSLVIHLGAPSSFDRYIHRLGRSGRAGKAGSTLLMLHDFERGLLDTMKDMQQSEVSFEDLMSGVPEMPDEMNQPLDETRVGQAYKAWLGYYRYFTKDMGWSMKELVERATSFAASIGAVGPDGKPPMLRRRTAAKLKIPEDTPGLNIVDKLPYQEETSQRMKMEHEEAKQAQEEWQKREEESLAMEMEIPILEAREILQKKIVPEGFQEVNGQLVPLHTVARTKARRHQDPQVEWNEQLRKRRRRRERRRQAMENDA